MASLKIYSNSGSGAGEAPISDKIASLKVNKHLIWEVIKAEQANARQGTHKTKTKAEVSGGGKKPWKQKGTGNARQGSTRSPQWRHGGIVFGPLPRSYADSISRQKKQVGVAHILAQKVQDKKVAVYDGLNLDKPSAKAAFQAISKIAAGAKLQTEGREKKKLRANSNKARHSIAVIMSSAETKDAKSLRNIPWVKPLSSSRIAATSLFYNAGLVISKAALQELDKKFSAVL
ncbi:MAG: 50S ribosomal protein L4 [Leptospiraceae bacterium]|nr:50S ribosomal protein L4 [Leptospiraceae bacterium]